MFLIKQANDEKSTGLIIFLAQEESLAWKNPKTRQKDKRKRKREKEQGSITTFLLFPLL